MLLKLLTGALKGLKKPNKNCLEFNGAQTFPRAEMSHVKICRAHRAKIS